IYGLANQASVAVVPHSAYFGPGLVATAHVSAALSRAPMIERLYCDLTESPFGDWYVPVDGHLALPQGPGLGVDPDPRLLERLRVAGGPNEDPAGRNERRPSPPGRAARRRTAVPGDDARISHPAPAHRRRHRGHRPHRVRRQDHARAQGRG